MFEAWSCPNGHVNPGLSNSCLQCSASRHGANPIVFVLWLFLLALFPVYPIAGGAAIGATVAITIVGQLLEPVIGSARFILLIAGVPAAFFYAFRYEQRASASKMYRRARLALRVGTGLLIVGILLALPGESSPSGAAIFLVIVAVPAVLWFLKYVDRAFGAAGLPA